MKRTFYISPNNNLEINFIKSQTDRTWYFVHWNKDEIDENGNYTIYTYKKTFSERIPVFKSKEWGIVCKIGNMLNGTFHEYFQISDSYSLNPVLNLDKELTSINTTLSFWSSIKALLFGKRSLKQ